MAEYLVTRKGTQAPLNGRYRKQGETIEPRPDNAIYYLECGWIEPITPPKARAKRSEVHDTGRTEPTA
jgi:hypothetical protein